MTFQKEHISGPFHRYNIRNIPMVVKEISENRFNINYSKLIRLLYEEECKHYNKPIKDNTKKMAFIYYIKIEKLNHMNNYNKFYINTRSLGKNRWFIPPRKKLC